MNQGIKISVTEDVTRLLIDDYNWEKYQLMDSDERFRDL